MLTDGQNITNIRRKRKVSKGIIYIQSSFNNTIISLTNLKSEVIFWASSGSCGFKGARKGTPFSAKIAIDKIIKFAKDQGIKTIQVIVKGPGPGRETVIRSLQKSNFEILLICDRTSIPHNGCRPPKKRRV
uniref:Small ribosomal subunit protein uS11c n=1 Tax=Bryopsis sp. HV04063 TaxID=1979421 RepID=A0A2P0QH66_9CHLO|nr:ribosomal protein S11 [Bryopsis sp. HV04063]ARO74121.1 ribosomal protein S11 [Bryopsis sp. HV04063]